MAFEESDAVQFADNERADDSQWPEWSHEYYRAWTILRDDRFFGAMGGIGRIYYSAISRYAEDHNFPLYPFLTFVRAIDGEYVIWCEEQSKKDSDTDKE